MRSLSLSLSPAGALLLALVGDQEAWSQEGAFQLPAEVCFENTTAFQRANARVCDRLRDPLPSQGQAVFI